MLNTVFKNVVPLLSLAALSVGCGKKINDASATPGNNGGGSHPWIEELPSAFRHVVDDGSFHTESTKLPKNGWLRLPTQLVGKLGSVEGREVHITLNLNDFGDFEYKCIYKDLNFVHCQDQGGAIVIPSSTFLESSDFPVDKGLHLRMELLNPSQTSLVIESTYQIDWK